MRLIIFNTFDKLVDYVAEAKKLDPQKFYRMSHHELVSPEGAVDRLAVVNSVGDCHKLQGLRPDSVHLDNPQSQEIIDALRVITKRRIQ